MANEIALLDSGVMENLMDERLVKRLGIERRKMLQPRRVFNVDGMENQHGTLTHYCLLRVKKGEKNFLQCFYITSLGSDHAIFGFPWLKMFNPNVDWGTGQVHSPHVVIETGLFQNAQEITLNQIVALAREQPEWEKGNKIIAGTSNLPTHAAQDWAIEANKHN